MNQHEPANLSPADAAAVDALVEAGFVLDAVPADLRERAAAVAGVLGLLDALPQDEPSGLLIARTLRHIDQHAMGDQESEVAAPVEQQIEANATVELGEPVVPVTLCDADAAAVDALIESKFKVKAVATEHRERAGRAAALLGLLDTLPEYRTGDLLLLPRTLEAIDRHNRSTRLDEQIAALAGGRMGRGGLRLSELGAVAAMFLIGLSVLWPVLSQARSDARQIACLANLTTAGVAMSEYARDFNHSMPATASRLGDSWWLTNQFNDDGTTRSNSAHLYVLVSNNYIKPADLACPTNGAALLSAPADARDWPDMASISYSYQNQATDDRTKLGSGPTIAVLADKNPLFATGQYRMDLCRKARDANSANHASGLGQNVLMSDNSVAWHTSPRLDNDDNIYHAGLDGFDNYTGLEAPASESDSFLVP